MAEAVGAVGSASNIRSDYLNLLVAQLKNQNPLEPMDNNEMASQLAQLSQLEQLENMNGSFAEVLQGQQASLASSWIGKEVGFLPSGTTEALRGRVESVAKVDGSVLLNVGNYAVDLDEIAWIGQ